MRMQKYNEKEDFCLRAFLHKIFIDFRGKVVKFAVMKPDRHKMNQHVSITGNGKNGHYVPSIMVH